MATVMLAGSTVVSTVSANAATDEKLPFSDVKEKNREILSFAVLLLCSIGESNSGHHD